MDDNQNKSKKIYLALIAILLLINGAAFYLLFNENKEKKAKVEQITKMDTEYKSLNQQFEDQKTELEGMKGKNTELDAIITQRQTEIEHLQGQLSVAQKSGKIDVQKYKNLIAGLEVQTKDLQVKIKELEGKNQELTAENLKVNETLVSEKKTTAILTEEKTKLADDNAMLEQKRLLGSILQPRNMKVEGIHKKSNGKEVAKKSAKHVDYLKISFETGENKVLEKGNLTLYLRVLNPKGETIAIADKGAGKLKLAEGGEEVMYSRKIDTEWQQANKAMAIEWQDNITDKGIYKVELYQAGYLISKGEVELK